MITLKLTSMSLVASRKLSYLKNLVYVLNGENYYLPSYSSLKALSFFETSPIWRFDQFLPILTSYIDHLYGPVGEITLKCSYYKGSSQLDVFFKNNLYENVANFIFTPSDIPSVISLDTRFIDYCAVYMLRPSTYNSESYL